MQENKIQEDKTQAANSLLCLVFLHLVPCIFESMILPHLHIAPTNNMGRGVFTSKSMKKDTVIEIAPVIVMNSKDRKLLDQTLMHDYIFEWGEKKDSCCMALGYVPLYNHSYKSNCEYEMNFRDEIITIKTVRNIKAGEELFINYNGDWNDGRKVWFDTK